jgi:hypothetical protein
MFDEFLEKDLTKSADLNYKLKWGDKLFVFSIDENIDRFKKMSDNVYYVNYKILFYLNKVSNCLYMFSRTWIVNLLLSQQRMYLILK